MDKSLLKRLYFEHGDPKEDPDYAGSRNSGKDRSESLDSDNLSD